MPTTPVSTFSPATNRLDPYMYPDDAREISVQLAQGSYAKGQVLGEMTGTNELQTITITGSPTGGTVTVTFGGQTTAAIPYNANAAQVQAALEALSTIGGGNVNVTGGPGPGTPFRVEFVNTLGGANQAAMTTTDSFTGGSSPASAVATVTNGAAGTAGRFKAYAATNADGSQVARLILQYACTVDVSNKVTLTGEWGNTYDYAPAYWRGTFRAEDLVGLDNKAVNGLGGRILRGTTAAGIFTF